MTNHDELSAVPPARNPAQRPARNFVDISAGNSFETPARNSDTSPAGNPWLDAPILPDGWNNGDDLFAADSMGSPGDAAGNTGNAAGNSAENSVPTTDSTISPADDSIPTDTDSAVSTTNGAAAENSRTYHLKVNHEEHDVTLTDSEVIARLQKSYAYDQWKQPAGLAEQIQQAQKLYPDLTEVPEEVAEDIANGSGFLHAYSAYRNRQDRREIEQLRRENDALRHYQDTLRRAPVHGISGGGNVDNRPRSDFERGFDSDRW